MPAVCEPAVEHPAPGIAYHRQPTPIVVVDRNLQMIAQSLDLDVSAFAGRIRRLVERHVAEGGASSRSTVDVLDVDTALRVVDLSSERGEYYAVTFERSQQRRDAIDAVATEHRLTKREREVFRMLLAGSSDSEVSERLVISRMTATDHAKNILRKTGSNKRTQLFAKVIKYDERSAPS